MFKKKIMSLWLFVAILSLSGFAYAGDLEPSAPPAPTMKTLDEIPPTWSQKISGAARFESVLWENLVPHAVLDKETGLVWELSPDTTARTWTQALGDCFAKEVGGRKGWHLPTIEQLASLVDSTQSNPALPSGNPFSNYAQSAWYWSSTTRADFAANAWVVFFVNGVVNSGNKAGNGYVWCVRGGP